MLQPAGAFLTHKKGSKIGLCVSQADLELSVELRRLPPKRVYTQKEIARDYTIPKSTMYAEIKKGTFPAKLPGWGRAARWDADAVESWYQRRIGARAEPSSTMLKITNFPDSARQKVSGPTIAFSCVVPQFPALWRYPN